MRSTLRRQFFWRGFPNLFRGFSDQLMEHLFRLPAVLQQNILTMKTTSNLLSGSIMPCVAKKSDTVQHSNVKQTGMDRFFIN